MVIEFLKWDSEFFGIKVGKLTIYDDMDFDPFLFKQQSNDEKFKLVYVFKFQKMLPWDKVLKADLHFVDIQLTMSKKFEKADYMNIPYDFRTELTDKERNECYKIAEDTSMVSRFYNENKIGKEKTKKMYHKWIDNSINKSFSDGLFLVKELNSVSGIHLIKTDNQNKIGYFTLTGVDPNYKRMGIGKNLWIQSFSYWANNSKIEIVRSPFSFQNSESFNFHLKMGFTKVEETKFIYHFRI
ncbi:MAG: TDP-fucosamine [Prolixibacteraceae bacterium]|nr:MAG: TDP-fucosamine [Prolixibacteraceae bacterium]